MSLKIFEDKLKEQCQVLFSTLGDLPKIELFARTKSEGWDTWGNEI